MAKGQQRQPKEKKKPKAEGKDKPVSGYKSQYGGGGVDALARREEVAVSASFRGASARDKRGHSERSGCPSSRRRDLRVGLVAALQRIGAEARRLHLLDEAAQIGVRAGRGPSACPSPAGSP